MNVNPAASVKFGDQLKITVPRPSAFAAFNSAHKASALPANFTVHKSSIPKPLIAERVPPRRLGRAFNWRRRYARSFTIGRE